VPFIVGAIATRFEVIINRGPVFRPEINLYAIFAVGMTKA